MRGDNFDLRNLKYVANKTVNKAILKKINEIQDRREQKILFEYSIKSALNLEYSNLKSEIDELKSKGKDIFTASIKLHLLRSKLHFLQLDFEKKDFKKINNLLNEIKKELKNARLG